MNIRVPSHALSQRNTRTHIEELRLTVMPPEQLSLWAIRKEERERRREGGGRQRLEAEIEAAFNVRLICSFHCEDRMPAVTQPLTTC